MSLQDQIPGIFTQNPWKCAVEPRAAVTGTQRCSQGVWLFLVTPVLELQKTLALRKFSSKFTRATLYLVAEGVQGAL